MKIIKKIVAWFILLMLGAGYINLIAIGEHVTFIHEACDFALACVVGGLFIWALSTAIIDNDRD